MQMEPHFLFNTLNAVTALVELGRQQQAVKMLRNLSVLLKSTLSSTATAKLTLAEEIRIVESYLAIEQERFADRLTVDLSVDADALEGMVPRFLLQPIVENCIEHGISRIREAGLIHASVRKSGDQLQFSIRDNGPGLGGKKEHQGHGIGLSNTAARLAQIYPSNHQITWGEPECGGFEVRIAIPYERAEQ